MVYLDNAATSYPKPECVIKEVEKCMREYCANPGRSGHAMAVKSGMAVNDAREALCSIFNISEPFRLAFTKNATEALNIAIKGTVVTGSHVITTGMEHNSVLRPLKTLEKYGGIELTIVRGSDLGEVEPEDIKKKIKKNTALIVVTLSSNVNGIIMPVAEIGRIARETGVTFLVDASQGAGSLEIDVVKQYIDLLAFPGHKGLMGPQGTGGLYVRDGFELNPLMEGGTGSESKNMLQPQFMPDRLESGTLNTPGIAGLGAAARFISEIGIKNIGIRKHRLTKMLIEGLKYIPGVKLYSVPDPNRNSGVVAMNLGDMDSNELSHILDKEFGIFTRAGFHCAPLAHKILGTEEKGVVRFSIGYFNTEADIAYAVEAVEKIALKKSIKH